MPSAAHTTLFVNARLVHPNGTVSNDTLVVKGGNIQAIQPAAPAAALLSQENVDVIDVKGAYLTPGLIDLHFHGGYGLDFNTATIAEIKDLLQKLPCHGITAALPTLMTAPLTDLVNAIATLEQVIHLQSPAYCQVLGMHLEGPFINPNFRGAHPLSEIPTTPEAAKSLLEALLSPNLKRVTMAVETDPQGVLTGLLVKHGVRISVGHSNASFEETQQSVKRGVTAATHLYNCMRAFHHRDPGLIGAVLTNDNLFAELIADGIHLHPETVRLTLKAKPENRLMLVSDCLGLAGQPEGAAMTFGQQRVCRENNQAINAEGHLAGSVYFLETGVKNLATWGVLPFERAVQLATSVPAAYMGIHDTHGCLQPGARANLVLWHPDTLAIVATWVNGQQVFGEGANAPASKVSLAH